jgi:valyl-tRNA synthetase
MDAPKEIPKNYDPKASEPKWLELWEKEGIYRFNPESDAEIFSIDTPPPTVSGKMHIGHSFSYSQQDFIARFHRMRGKNVFYPFGTDDNGLATNLMIEKIKNVRGRLMKRQDFNDLCLKTLEEIRPDFVQDWKAIGISADFNIFYTTINKHCQKVSQKSFLDINREGRIYRKKAPIMFCPNCTTAIAQVELKDAEKQSHLVYIKAKAEKTGEELVFATTRPELIYGCVGISVHPDDKRYRHLLGTQIEIPLINRRVELIADEATDMEYGSGVVYYCTYGGVDCIEWMMRHPKVSPIDVMGVDGRYNENAPLIKGMKSEDARKKIIEELQKIGAVVKLEKITHIVNTHERCDTDIEYVSTNQWYVKYLDLKDDFINYGRIIKWYPEHMRARYENWILGLKWDWNISRQRHFGVPIPVWYCAKCHEMSFADEKQLPVDPLTDKPIHPCSKCGSHDFAGEKDVLDTWATSSLTPDIAIELFHGKHVAKKLHPMSLRPQAHDIITFWLFNTVVKSYFHHKRVPWHNVMISGWALDPHGKKMSKSKGNVVDPRIMIAKYSADSLRYWAAGSRLGDDLPFQDKDLLTGQKFATKIWNASKFASMHLSGYNLEMPGKLEMMDRWLLSKLSRIVKGATESFENYEYSHGKLETDKFFWQVFCDNYLEIIKDRIYNPDRRGQDAMISAKFGLYTSLLTVIKLMAPIMPFITEELYQAYFREKENSKSVHLSKWPGLDMADDHAEHIGDFAVSVIEFVRKEKTAKQVSLKTPVKHLTIRAKIEEKDFEEVEADIKASTSAEKIIFEPTRGLNPEKDLEIQAEF